MLLFYITLRYFSLIFIHAPKSPNIGLHLISLLFISFQKQEMKKPKQALLSTDQCIHWAAGHGSSASRPTVVPGVQKCRQRFRTANMHDKQSKNAGVAHSQMGCAFPSGALAPSAPCPVSSSQGNRVDSMRDIRIPRPWDSPTGRQNGLNRVNHLNRKTS